MKRKRILVKFFGGPLDAVTLDSESAVGNERHDVSWILAKTRNGHPGSEFYFTEQLRTARQPRPDGRYWLESCGEDADERHIRFIYEEEWWGNYERRKNAVAEPTGAPEPLPERKLEP